MSSRPVAIVYIDGFNLYYGLLRGTPHRWLDLSAFARRLLLAYDVMRHVNASAPLGRNREPMEHLGIFTPPDQPSGHWRGQPSFGD